MYSNRKKMVGHVPERLDKILFPLFKIEKTLDIRVVGRRESLS